MNREDIIKMAREAGLFVHKEVQPEIERFFQLATEWERKRMAWTQEHWTEYEHNIAAAAKAEEREQLLKLSTKAHDVDGHCDIVLSADIRARGETK